MVSSSLPRNERWDNFHYMKSSQEHSFLGRIEIYSWPLNICDFKVDLSTLSMDQNSSNHTVFAATSKVTLTDSEAEYINIAKKRTALQIQTLNRISGLPDLEPTSPISADNKINFSSRQACPERTLSKVENVRLSRSAGNKVCSGRVMKTNRIQITI